MIPPPRQSPALNPFTIGFERSFWERLGKEIGIHPVGRTLDDSKLLPIVCVPEPVPFGQEVLSPGRDPLVRGQEVGALVVLEHGGV